MAGQKHKKERTETIAMTLAPTRPHDQVAPADSKQVDESIVIGFSPLEPRRPKMHGDLASIAVETWRSGGRQPKKLQHAAPAIGNCSEGSEEKQVDLGGLHVLGVSWVNG